MGRLSPLWVPWRDVNPRWRHKTRETVWRPWSAGAVVTSVYIKAIFCLMWVFIFLIELFYVGNGTFWWMVWRKASGKLVITLFIVISPLIFHWYQIIVVDPSLAFQDKRLAGGYENVPTDDIHMNQVCCSQLCSMSQAVIFLVKQYSASPSYWTNQSYFRLVTLEVHNDIWPITLNVLTQWTNESSKQKCAADRKTRENARRPSHDWFGDCSFFCLVERGRHLSFDWLGSVTLLAFVTVGSWVYPNVHSLVVYRSVLMFHNIVY